MMRELTEEYLQALPKKISDIEAHFLTMDVTVLREDFHKLKGTGRTYGLPEISQVGEIVERLCLESPSKIAEIIPPVLQLLREIYQSRMELQKPLSLEVDQRYSLIQNMLSR